MGEPKAAPHLILIRMFIIDDLLLLLGSTLIGGAVGGLVGGAAGALISFVIDVFLDVDSIGEEIQIHYPDALKLLIQEKKKNAVKVGIFGEYDKEIETCVEITSSQGVSDNLYVGQLIYL